MVFPQVEKVKSPDRDSYLVTAEHVKWIPLASRETFHLESEHCVQSNMTAPSCFIEHRRRLFAN